MTSDAMAAGLERIRTRFARLRELEEEHGFGVLIADGVPLVPLPGVPEGTAEVFGIVGRIEGSNFRFGPPSEITSLAALRGRSDDPDDPLGPALSIGYEVNSVPPGLREAIQGGERIALDLTDGDVYHISADDYVFLYTNVEEEVDPYVHVLAPDIVTFFDECVLGERYPQLVDTVLGPGVREERVRRGRFKGQYQDTWLRLLVTAGLVPPPA